MVFLSAHNLLNCIFPDRLCTIGTDLYHEESVVIH